MNAFVKSIEVPQRSVKIKYILDTSHFNTSFLKCAGWEGLISGICEKKTWAWHHQRNRKKLPWSFKLQRFVWYWSRIEQNFVVLTQLWCHWPLFLRPGNREPLDFLLYFSLSSSFSGREEDIVIILSHLLQFWMNLSLISNYQVLGPWWIIK